VLHQKGFLKISAGRNSMTNLSLENPLVSIPDVIGKIVTLIKDEEDFLLLRSVWNELLQKSIANNIFLTWEWLYSWWQSYKKPDWELYILLIKKDNLLIGIAPFYLSTTRTAKIFAVKELNLLGYGSYDSEYLDVISETGKEDIFFEVLFNYLKENKEQWDTLALNEIPENSNSHTLIAKYSGRDGYRVISKKRECAYVTLPETWEGYLASMHYNFRKKLRHFMKRLEKSHSVEFTQCPTKENLSLELESLFALHQKHWEGEFHEGSFSNVQRKKFYHDMANYFLEKNWLRLYSLKVDGQFTAHQYCFEYNNKVFSLQDGFDPDWGDKRVARILRGYVLRDLIGRGVKEYDFLGELSEYKKKWEAKGKYSINTLIIRKNYRTLLHVRIPATIKKIRGVIKRNLPENIVQKRENRIEEKRKRDVLQKINGTKDSITDENSD